MYRYYFKQRTPGEIDQSIAERLRDIRKRRGLSQARLSEKADVSLGSLKRFEQTGQISLLSLTKIAIALELSEELEALFENAPFLTIKEVMNGSDQ